jgi:hypothetical protein
MGEVNFKLETSVMPANDGIIFNFQSLRFCI